MQFTLDKNPSKIFLLLLLVIPCRKATNSAGPGVLLHDSAQLVDQIRTLNSPNHLLLKHIYAHGERVKA